MTKVVICGDRHGHITPQDWSWLVSLIANELNGDVEIVHGGAKGVDQEAQRLAQALNLPCRVFEADWNTHGRAAGPIRNQQMIDYAAHNGILIAFPGGKGTADCTKRAVTAGMTVRRPHS